MTSLNTYALHIVAGDLTLCQLRQVAHHPTHVTLDSGCYDAINRSCHAVARVMEQGRTVYGINTGFGLLANTSIVEKDLELLQHSIVVSHAAGVGDLMDDATVRLMMVLKINSLARGFSGIRLSVIDSLIALVNHQVYPCVPKKGSVGASGDLAPLAHMSAILIGEGQARYQGNIISAHDALSLVGLSPIALAPKEGLALLNGTQASTAFSLQGLFACEDLWVAGTAIGALSVDAAMGSRRPFDKRVHEVRGHQSQMDSARAYRHFLEDTSEIAQSHDDCDKVQDPYSLRCQPQVMGACLQQIRGASEIVLTEANAVSDNPLIFVGAETHEDDFISAGNFHAEPIAMASDNLALAIAEIGALSERRMALLIDSNLSGLPPFLVNNGGVNSGFMIAQVTSAALASENKSLAHPASVDSLPTSANQEDHVSMATFAGRRLQDMADNTVGILAIEYLASCQGIDFRAPHKTSATLEAVKSILRKQVDFYDKDRYFAPDIEQAKTLIKQGALNTLIPNDILPSFGGMVN